jgi:hypothetical protein
MQPCPGIQHRQHRHGAARPIRDTAEWQHRNLDERSIQGWAVQSYIVSQALRSLRSKRQPQLQPDCVTMST